MKLFIYLGILSFNLLALPPDWFFLVNQDKDILIGVGSNSSLEKAKAQALADLASSINVTISTKSFLSQERNDIKIKEKLQNQIFIGVEDIDLSSITVLNQDFNDNFYYIRVGIKRELLLHQIYQNLMQQFKKLSRLHTYTCALITPDIFYKLQTIIASTQKQVKIYQSLGGYQSFDTLDRFLEVLHQNSPKPKMNINFSGGDTQIHHLITKELAKFSILNQQMLQGYPTWDIFLEDENKKSILTLMLRDCHNNLVYEEQIFLDSAKRHRIGFILYKKLQNWLKE